MLRTRWIVRLPVLVYRVRLGVLFGDRLLMLEHTGRVTGKRRFVVLEVVAHFEPDSYIVVSGFGGTAQWYRNVGANPSVVVHIKSRRPATARARHLGQEASQVALADYRTRHPRAWANLRPVLEETLGTEIDDQHPELPMIALDLDGGRRHADEASSM